MSCTLPISQRRVRRNIPVGLSVIQNLTERWTLWTIVKLTIKTKSNYIKFLCYALAALNWCNENLRCSSPCICNYIFRQWIKIQIDFQSLFVKHLTSELQQIKIMRSGVIESQFWIRGDGVKKLCLVSPSQILFVFKWMCRQKFSLF